MVFRHRFVPEGDDIFAELKKIRTSRKVSLQKLSDETKIPIKYLLILEEGSTKKLPDVLYVKNMIKKYLEFFGIEPNPYIAKLNLPREERSAPKKNIKNVKLMVVPRTLKAVAILLIVLAILGYLGWNISRIFEPPEITVLYPGDKETVSQSVIEVRGIAERGTTLSINGQQVILDRDGNWREEVNLQKGLNLIKISGIKRYGKERVMWLNVNLEIK